MMSFSVLCLYIASDNKFLPMRPAFAMTISKSQGQTLDEPLFTHGQLYVASSRESSPHNIKNALNNVNKTTRNVVYKQVLLN